MLETFYILVMVVNALWLGAGFRYFSIKSGAAAKILVPREHRSSPVYKTLVASSKFLGGMNLALAVLAVAVLAFRDTFSDARQIAIICAVFAVAHGSQFAFNAPIAIKQYNNQPFQWSVLSGPMLFIFVVDGVLTLTNCLVIILVVLL